VHVFKLNDRTGIFFLQLGKLIDRMGFFPHLVYLNADVNYEQIPRRCVGRLHVSREVRTDSESRN
jgi:hypothetical protein